MADTPKILGSDTLRIAYPKINMAIDNSNKAITKATTAETNAADAKSMSESTQTQLNNIIIESGTSDAEVIQARGGSPVLNDRLNKYDGKTPINAFDVGVIGDRAVDESPFIQSAIDAAIAAGLKELVFPKKTYRIEKPIYIRDSLIIDFQGSTFEWYGQNTIGGNVYGEIGMFNIRGELDSSYDQNIIGYIRSLSTTTQLPPSTAPTLLTLEVPNLSDTNTRYEAGCKITTSNNGHFTVGDDVLLMGWTRATYRPYDATKFEPELRKVAKVVAIDASYVYLDYAPPFNYPIFVNNDVVKSVVMKVDLVENVILKNINMKDMISEPLGTSSNSTHWADTPSGISELLSKNVEIQNYHMENHRFNALYAQYSNNLRHTNIKAKNAQWWGGGQGYCIQYIACDEVVNENIIGDACRHVVDVSWSSNVQTKTARGYNPRAEDFTHHGCTEHDIRWEDCEGDFRFGHGIEYFPEIIESVTIDKSNISVRNNNSCVVFDLVMNQTRVKCFGFQNFSQVTYNNCDIRAFFITSAVAANNRDTGRTRYTIINDSKIDIKAFDGTRLVLGFYDYEILNFKNIEFNMDQSVLDLFTSQPVITLSNFKNAVIDGADANQLCMSIRQTLHSDCTLDLVNSTINLVTKSGSDIFNFVTNQNTSISVKVLNNRINYKLVGSAGYANIFLLSSAVTNSTVIMNISGNHLIGSAPNTIQGRKSAGTGSTVYIQDFKNVIKNAGTNATFVWSNENVLIQ